VGHSEERVGREDSVTGHPDGHDGSNKRCARPGLGGAGDPGTPWALLPDIVVPHLTAPPAAGGKFTLTSVRVTAGITSTTKSAYSAVGQSREQASPAGFTRRIAQLFQAGIDGAVSAARLEQRGCVVPVGDSVGIAALHETSGPPSRATLTAQPQPKPSQTTGGGIASRSRADRPAAPATRPGRDRRRGVRWWRHGRGSPAQCPICPLVARNPWALRNAESDSDPIAEPPRMSRGVPTPHERSWFPSEIPTKE